MILYIGIILFCGTAVALANGFGYGDHMGWTFAITFGGILLQMIVNGATAGVCRSLPKKCVPYGAKVFQVGKKEKLFYEKLHIRKWKDYIPEIGHLTGFRKTKVEDPKSTEYVERFLLETRYGELGHFSSFFTSFLLMFLCFIPAVRWTIVLPICVIGALLNVPSFFVLRYNSYKLEVLYKANKKREGKGSRE